MNKRKEYRHTLLLPEKVINWLKKIKENPPNITAFNTERAAYILSTIVTHKQQKHPGAYSMLYMPYLRNVIHNAHEYIEYFRKAGVIEYKNHYSGRNSRLYRIKKDYDGSVLFRTITDNKLNRQIEKNFGKIKNRNSKKYPKLNEYVYSVSIDYDAALHTIDERYKYSISEDPEGAEARRTFSLAEIDKINNKQIYIKVSQTNGRYDTNYTRLPGELVPHLTIDGQPLTEIDIRNSQPFFAVALFNPSPEVEKVITDYLGSRFTMYIKSLQLAQYEDIKLYISLVQSGNFYEYMMEKFKLNGIDYKDRDAAKEMIFTVYFGKNSAIHYSASVKLFRSLFPNVYRLFEAIKEKEHNRLAILLQRIESHVILDIAGARIIKELPEVKFITKHDSILPAGLMVTDAVVEVSRILTEVVEDIVGAKPLLKIKSGQALFSSYSSSNTTSNTSSNTPLPFICMKTL